MMGSDSGKDGDCGDVGDGGWSGVMQVHLVGIPKMVVMM
jgi:hypothetical protein